jgi:hypothetical protein
MSENRDENPLRPTQVALMVIAGLGVFGLLAAWITLKVIQASVEGAMKDLD